MRCVAMFMGVLVASVLGAVPAFASDESASVVAVATVPDLLPLAGVIGVILLAGVGYRKAGG
ncbi:MAG: hypothetical protein Q4B08_15355 [Propionibacteriaceae bacterium]|nr:hypothetical protein [Propionibacteriaceae bacterium]